MCVIKCYTRCEYKFDVSKLVTSLVGMSHFVAMLFHYCTIYGKDLKIISFYLTQVA